MPPLSIQPKFATMGRDNRFSRNWAHASVRRKSVSVESSAASIFHPREISIPQ